MMLHRFHFRRPIGSSRLRFFHSRPALLIRETLVILFCSTGSASALPPIYNSMASRIVGQAVSPAAEDPFLQSMRRWDPYGAEDGTDPMWAAAGVATEDLGNLQVLDGRQNADSAFRCVSRIACALNHSLAPK
jgi:hypothetical protein